MFDSATLTIRPAGVPGAFDERSRPSTMMVKRSGGLGDAVAALYEAQKGERKRIVPGYTGHIPGVKEIAGRSQVRAAARASTHTPKELAEGDTLPADPVHKDSLARVEAAYADLVLGRDMGATLVGRNQDSARHISGYTGALCACGSNRSTTPASLGSLPVFRSLQATCLASKTARWGCRTAPSLRQR